MSMSGLLKLSLEVFADHFPDKTMACGKKALMGGV